jgi:hypothetical protein
MVLMGTAMTHLTEIVDLGRFSPKFMTRSRVPCFILLCHQISLRMMLVQDEVSSMVIAVLIRVIEPLWANYLN